MNTDASLLGQGVLRQGKLLAPFPQSGGKGGIDSGYLFVTKHSSGLPDRTRMLIARILETRLDAKPRGWQEQGSRFKAVPPRPSQSIHDQIMPARIPTVLLSTFLCSCATAFAEFEKWTDVQGRVAEMEIADVRGEGEATEVEFRLRTGKQAAITLAKLDAASRLRVGAWRKRHQLTSKFIRIQTEKDLSRVRPGDPPDRQSLSFLFTVHGENIIGVHSQEPVVTSVKVGDEQSFKWRNTGSRPAKVPTRVSFRLFANGAYNAEDLKTAEFSGSVTVLTSPGSKVVKKVIKLPSKQGDRLTQKIGELTVVAEWGTHKDPFSKGAPQTMWVSASHPRSLQVIETNVEIDGVSFGQRVPTIHAGKKANVKIKLWDKVREVRVNLTKTADDPGMEVFTENDV